MARNLQAWSDICSTLTRISFTIALSFSMLFFVFITANITWTSYQETYLDIKELKTLRALPAELAKGNASLLKAEARVKELEPELAKPKQENKASSSPAIKCPVAAVKSQKAAVPKAQNWFSEQWALYSFLKVCFRGAPERQRYWQGFEKQVKAATAKADEVSAALQERTVRLELQAATAKADEELKAQVAKNTGEMIQAVYAHVEELMAPVTKELEDFKQQFAVKMLENKTRHANNAKELAASHAMTQAHLRDLQVNHDRTEAQINEQKAQLTMSDQSKHSSPEQEVTLENPGWCTWSESSSTDLQGKGNFVGVLTQQLPGITAEDRLLCPEEPKLIEGQENNAILQFEIATDKRHEQSCVTVAEEVKRLEVAEKKVEEEKLKAEREQQHSRFIAVIQQDYEVLDMP